MRNHTLTVAVLLTLGGLSGCKEDPPPPPPATGSASPAAASGTAAARQQRAKVPRVSPLSMKRYRVDTCYFGSLGLRVARDAYLASLGGAEPSPTKLPEFGDYSDGEPAPAKAGDADPPKARVPGRPPSPMAAARQLPFMRHVRACSIAKALKDPAVEGLDPALVEFDAYVSKLNKALMDATRYYGRKQWEKDEFSRGKAIHETLVASFGQLDDELAKLGEAVNKWMAAAEPGPEKLDDAGKVGVRAEGEARKLTLALLAETRDGEAVTKLTEELSKSLAELEELNAKDKTAPHPRIVVPKLKTFVAAVEAAAKIEGKLSPTQAYPISAEMANLVEANQRALAQLLRQQAGPSGPRQRVMPPKLREGAQRPRVRAGRPQPPTGEPAEVDQPAKDEAASE